MLGMALNKQIQKQNKTEVQRKPIKNTQDNTYPKKIYDYPLGIGVINVSITYQKENKNKVVS